MTLIEGTYPGTKEMKRQLLISSAGDELILHVRSTGTPEFGITIAVSKAAFVEALVPLEEDDDKTPESP